MEQSGADNIDSVFPRLAGYAQRSGLFEPRLAVFEPGMSHRSHIESALMSSGGAAAGGPGAARGQ